MKSQPLRKLLQRTSPSTRLGVAVNTAPSRGGSPITALVDGPVFGPVWLDPCGAEGDVNMNFCRRIALPRIQSALSHHD